MISDQLRDAILASEHTPYGLAKLAKLDPSAIRKFVARERGLSLDTFDPLAELLDLCLVKRGEAPEAKEPPNFQLEIERRARELAEEWVTEGFDSILRERVFRSLKGIVAQKDYDSIKRHTDQGL